MNEKYRNICIVGNSGSLLNSKCGSKIDSHKHIARINNFSIAHEYQEDVGNKVDVWVTSLFGDVEDRNELIEKVFVPFPRKSRYVFSKALLEKYKDRMEFMPDGLFKELLRHAPNPSTGLSFLFWTYKSFGIDDDRVFGFSFFSKKHKHHYADGQDKCYHEGSIEQDVYNEMRRGRL